MKKKALAILLSILMLTSVTLPGTWATDETEFPEDTTEVTEVAEPEPETETEAETEAESEPEETEAEPEPETDAPEETDVPDESETEEETETETETEPESETETESEAEAEIFDPYAAVEYLYTLDSNEAIIAYLQSLTEDELAAVQAVLEDWGMWADIAAMLYPAEAPEEAPAEAPEGMPPEDWGSTSLEGAVPFTNAVSMFSLIPREASGNDSGVVLNKTVAEEEDGDGFKITLEAYATGVQTTVSSYEPADIVLVLDTSGSMYAGMQDSDFEPVYSSSVSIDPDSYYDCYRKYWVIEDGEFVNACVINVDRVKNNNATPQWRTQKNWKTSGSTFYPSTRAYDSASNHKQFYVVKSGQSRLDSLKASVNSFISNVFTTSAESSIAIIPFGTNVGTVTEFTSNQTTLNNAVAALTPNGGTNSGVAMAKAVELLNSDTVKNNGRKKVVVMFTDGTPCSSGDAFDNSIANTAISNSHTLKTNGVTVYTIGVFDGANGSLEDFGEYSSDTNKYMHYVSSNYPEATSMTVSGERNNELNGKSYYLSATNSSELLNIFQLISSQVGGATNTTLNASTVVKDIIAPSFAVPANASDIKLYTANCTGAGLTFGDRTPATGVTATITGDTLDVTGFDFSANWCGSHSGPYSGKKLIIEFTVSPKEGFLGGNNVPTNGDTSGMYLNGTKVALFDVPTVNVPIKDITITAKDKNVYLTQVPTEEQLKTDVTIECGTVDITDPSKLDDWKKAYVNLESSFTTSDGFNAIQDGTYTVTASVSPKAEGDSTKPGTVATVKSKTETKNINVFKPELTYEDSTAYYGGNAPSSYDSNKTSEVWKHGDTLDTAVTMIGDAPDLTMTYTSETGKIKEGKIDTKQDIAVDVAVKIGTTNVTSYTTFQHTDCTGKTCGKPENGKFWLHVKTCQLTITKTGGAANESYVFDVYKDGVKYTEVTIWGNGSETIYELPVGTYTIKENTGWSWRYDANNGSVATLAAQNASGSITCTNASKNEKWLNGFSTIVKNIFGVTKEQTGN